MARAPRTARNQIRQVLAPVIAGAILVAALGSAAAADPSPSPGPSGPSAAPSQAELNRARRDVEQKQQSVADLQAALAAAKAQLDAATTAAEIAAENYNGALWRLSEARKEARRAERQARQAAEEVRQQRRAIITLVTESYQNGTELSTATALVGEDGPQGLMNRYGVVQSAGDSMKARYDEFRVASRKAKTYAARAETAKERQKGLADQAHELRDQAGRAAEQAAYAANSIAAQRAQVIAELAKAQDISLELATQRQDYLEQQAAAKAAAAARAEREAREAEAQAAARRAAQQAAARAADARTRAEQEASRPDPVDTGSVSVPVPAPVPAPPVDSSPPSSNRSAVQRALDYARAQIGKPYQWGATGPSTFDCSGLTMRAWQAGGKYLPHYSAAQFQYGTRIAVSSAKAGDLYFWTDNGSPSGIHHVAIAIGGGQFIEAPHTGALVRYNSIYSWWPDYAVRL